MLQTLTPGLISVGLRDDAVDAVVCVRDVVPQLPVSLRWTGNICNVYVLWILGVGRKQNTHTPVWERTRLCGTLTYTQARERQGDRKPEVLAQNTVQCPETY